MSLLVLYQCTHSDVICSTWYYSPGCDLIMVHAGEARSRVW